VDDIWNNNNLGDSVRLCISSGGYSWRAIEKAFGKENYIT
jgi:hypothetical protein